MKRLLFLTLACLLTATGLSAKTEKVSAEYTYYAPETMSIEEAKRTALERAKIQAIADAFGTVVTQSNTTVVSNNNGVADTRFFSLGGSDIKGEWIETIGAPEYQIAYEQGQLVVSVTAKGRIRPFSAPKAAIRVKILRNGTDDRFESSDFNAGDDLYMSFMSPVDGNLLIYLIDYANDTAYCLLPYSRSSDIAQRIDHDRRYLFFSSGEYVTGSHDEIDEYTMTCDSGIEQNGITVIFSPDEIIRPVSASTSVSRPRQLPLGEFDRWLADIRKHDNRIQIQTNQLSIKK